VRPQVIAHRGASVDAPENTLAAFELAARQGADGVELDVRTTRDGEVVVFHDPTLKRLCGRPDRLARMTAREVREARLLSGHGIPRLADVFGVVPAPMILHIELKHDASGVGLARATAEVVRQAGREVVRRVVLSSFDPALLAEAWMVAPELPRALIFGEDQALPMRRGWLAPAVGASAMHASRMLVDAQTVRGWHARGYAVRVWTVDDEAELRWLRAIGVDAAITNRPALAMRIYDEPSTID
jgi:glycerophosphoryl diester phosphodiesterase